MRFSKQILIAMVAAGGMGCLVYAAERKPWKVPETATRIQNPVRSEADSLAAGKKVYTRECMDCHGKAGKGDGPGAKDLEAAPPSLRIDEVQEQSDGALFWKITKGRGEMPAYRKSLSDEERWHLVNYVRTLADERTAQAKGGNP